MEPTPVVVNLPQETVWRSRLGDLYVQRNSELYESGITGKEWNKQSRFTSFKVIPQYCIAHPYCA